MTYFQPKRSIKKRKRDSKAKLKLQLRRGQFFEIFANIIDEMYCDCDTAFESSNLLQT